jgi:hypothetical protein
MTGTRPHQPAGTGCDMKIVGVVDKDEAAVIIREPFTHSPEIQPGVEIPVGFVSVEFSQILSGA